MSIQSVCRSACHQRWSSAKELKEEPYLRIVKFAELSFRRTGMFPCGVFFCPLVPVGEWPDGMKQSGGEGNA
mgnify:CR=1 FL=1